MEFETEIECTPIEEERKSCFSDDKLELEKKDGIVKKDEATIKARIQAAERLHQTHNQASARIREKIFERKMDLDKCKSRQCSYSYKEEVARRDTIIEYLQHALYTIYCIKSPTRGEARKLLSPVEELDEQINSLHYRIQHGRNTIAKEKQLVQEIKVKKEAREKLVVDVVEEAKMTSSFKSKEAIEDIIKYTTAAREILKKKNLENGIRMNHILQKSEAIDNDITRLQRNLADVNQKKVDTYRRIFQLRTQRDYAI